MHPTEHPLKVFIVDDSAATVENLSAMLEQLCDARVVGSAGDEATALAGIRREHLGQGLDLIIVDIFLRHGSGLGLLGKLSDPGFTFARAVISNYARTEIEHACLALGVDRFFDKSTDVDALVDYCQDLRTRITA